MILPVTPILNMAASSVFKLFIFLPLCIWTFNIDEENYLVFNGDPGSHFGFSSGLLKNNQGRWLLVGAPKANFSNNPDIPTPGNVYRCLVNLTTKQQERCHELTNLRTGETTKRREEYSYEEENQLLGANMLVTQSKVLVCSSLWKTVYYEYTEGYVFAIGYCYELEKSNLTVVKKIRFEDMETATNLKTSDGRFKFGMAQVGFSTTMMNEHFLWDIVYGAPGINSGKGGFVLGNTNKTGRVSYKHYRIEEDPILKNSTKDGTFAGYSIGSGEFGLPSDAPFPLVIIGTPRFSNRDEGHVGAVILLLAMERLMTKKTLTGDQTGSGFGSTMCIADINGDGKDDLLVGAPLYTFGIGTENLYECGKVYVFYGTRDSSYVRKQPDSHNLVGMRKSKSRFGLTITNVGDINADSFNDIVIGAPYEDDMNGAIYIYNGGAGNINHQYSQRISGQSFQPKLHAFGMQVSYAFDIDDNQYGDFAVGAYMADTVIVLRTRPIVNMTATMTITPDVIPLNSSGLNCSVDITKPCAQIQLCFKFEGIGVNDGILIDFDVKADTLRTEARKTSRIQLYIGDEMHSDQATKNNFKVTKGEKTCITVDGRVQTVSREFYGAISEELKIKGEFRLSNKSLPGRVFPILNEQLSRTVEKSAYFEKECVGKCRSNLNLEMSTVGLTGEIVVGETDEVAFRIKVKNRNQPSYATSVFIYISNNTRYLGSQIFEGSRTVTCMLYENYTSAVGNDVVQCDIDKPLYQHHLVDFQVRLNVSLGALVPCENCYDDMMSAITIIADVDTQGSIEEDISDNKKAVSVPIKFESILEVNGISTPEQHKLSSESKDDYFEFSHTYFVYNTGPSPLPSTRIILDIPVKGDGAEKLTERNQITVESSLVDSECKLLSFIDGLHIEKTTISDKSTLSSSLLVSTSTSTIDSRTVPTAEPQRRKKRETQPLTDQTSIQTITNITCETFACAKYECTLKALDVQEKASFTIKTSVKKSVLSFGQNDILLRYKTKGEIEQPAHKLFYPWNRGLYYQAYIDFFPEKLATPSTKINIWIIIGGCLGGLALIIILGIILWRCGFFKRKQPKEFMDWKRQSIRNRRIVRSSSSKSTKSYRYEPQEVARLTRSSKDLNGK